MQRHEEKYIIEYAQYAVLKARAEKILTPDIHGKRPHTDSGLGEPRVVRQTNPGSAPNPCSTRAGPSTQV